MVDRFFRPAAGSVYSFRHATLRFVSRFLQPCLPLLVCLCVMPSSLTLTLALNSWLECRLQSSCSLLVYAAAWESPLHLLAPPLCPYPNGSGHSFGPDPRKLPQPTTPESNSTAYITGKQNHNHTRTHTHSDAEVKSKRRKPRKPPHKEVRVTRPDPITNKHTGPYQTKKKEEVYLRTPYHRFPIRFHTPLRTLTLALFTVTHSSPV